ncbi:MAG: hypothetical protein VKK97_08360 [Synechococcaceae cyanobacterium]|nr:hypothetical protein [Synechococcaceae cyanobacterium]
MPRSSPQLRPRSASRLRWLLIALASLVSALLFAPGFLNQPSVEAQQAGYGQTMGSSLPERQFYDYGPGTPSSSSGTGGGSLLNSTNPMDLMNKLRKANSLDDATSPSSAIDQALKDLEANSAAAAPTRSGSGPTVKAP